MKKLLLLFATFAMLCTTSCSDIDTENPVINMPSSGNVNNEGEDESKKVSIVGTWQATYVTEGFSHTFQVMFNNDNSGVWTYKYPTWPDEKTVVYETHRSNFTYKYDMNHALLTLTNIYYGRYMESTTEELTAFITSHDGKDVLHFHSSYPAIPTAFTRIK